MQFKDNEPTVSLETKPRNKIKSFYRKESRNKETNEFLQFGWPSVVALFEVMSLVVAGMRTP